MSGASAKTTALVLAGQREGRLDPLAEAAGVTLKALSPVFGEPMIIHAIRTLAASPRIGKIIVSINAGSGVEDIPEIAELIAARRLEVSPARGALVESVLDALAGARFPVLITTADTVLMTPGAIEEIDGAARAEQADVAIALARKASVLAAHPQGQRRFYQFSDDAYSNCNSYWIGHARALAMAELFRSGGQFVKHPGRVIGALGLAGVFELVRFRFGIGSLSDGCRRLSKRFGLTIRPVVVSDGALAIDVDAERTLRVAEEVIGARRQAISRAA